MPTHHKRMLLVATGTSIAVLSLGASGHLPKLIFYNPSPSAPIGWYARVPLGDITPGQLVLARLPPATARLAEARHYLPRGIPVLKQIAAREGDAVCERNGAVRINGRFAAQALTRDRASRPLSPWSGCRRLRADEVFLLNPNRYSFDSRYYGPVSSEDILGAATPLWTREEGSNR